MKTLLVLAFLASLPAHASFLENTVTVSFPADKPDEATVKWTGVDFETGQTLVEPRMHAPNWMLRLRQGYVSTNAGAAAKLEKTTFEAVAQAPEASEFTADESYDPWGPAPEDTYNRPLMDWYSYYMFQGHLLAPKAYVFVLRTSDNHFAKVQFLDYVKEGKAIRNGKSSTVSADDHMVHVKLRYKYNTEAGSRALN